MIIKITCRECSSEMTVELPNKRYFLAECDAKHKNRIVIQSNLFELLFDLGCMAFLDGYYREAVFNFNLSLERFRECLIKFTLTQMNMPADLISNMWKGMENQSERQFGAYQLLHAITYKHQLPKNDPQVSLRNKVIHKGYLPTKEETRKFAEIIFEEIKNFYFTVEKEKIFYYNCSVLCTEEIDEPNKYPSTTIAFPGFECLGVRNSHTGQLIDSTFNDKLISVEEWKNFYQFC